MLKGLIVISLLNFILANGDTVPDRKLEEFFKNYFSEQGYTLQEEKTSIYPIIDGLEGLKKNYFECLLYDGQWTTSSVEIIEASRQKQSWVSIFENVVKDEQWPTNALDQLKSVKGRNVKMSNVLQIGDRYYLVAFKSSDEYWLDIVYPNNGQLNSCKVTYTALH